MGAIFTCLDEDDPMMSLGIEEKANVTGDRIKKAKYVGPLYSLVMLESVTEDPKSFDFKEPIGEFK